jgi:hypothetical protein
MALNGCLRGALPIIAAVAGNQRIEVAVLVLQRVYELVNEHGPHGVELRVLHDEQRFG